ncbi:MAG: hypothetical protein QCH96_06465 [Candidatus Thermoplasmatota archaeon]|nr:hypothetical protein [Candidatus Thermoplasmatota archaeon]
MTYLRLERFHTDRNAVIDLPMRLIVSVIIGTIALSTIIAVIVQPCLFPRSLSISIDPLTHTINDTSSNISFQVHVIDDSGHPVSHATVIIKGLDTIKSNVTDDSGDTLLILSMRFPEGISEMFLDVIVKAPCATTRTLNNYLRIIKHP